MVDKDNRDVCGLSAVDPCPNCGLAYTLCSRMLPSCPGRAWLNRSCQAGTVVGWLVPMVQSSPGEGRMALQTIVVPRICRSSSSSGAFRGSPCSGAANTLQPTAATAAAAIIRRGAATKKGSLQQQQKQQQRTGATYCIL